MNDMDADMNRLTVDGTPFTPKGLQVREVLDVTDDDVLCVVQRTPELLPAADLPFLWQSNADDHDARSFDVVSIRYDGTWEPLTYLPGQWTMSRAGDGCVVTGRGMDDAAMQMQHCMNVRTTDGDGDGVDAADMMSMVVSPIENHAETPVSCRTCDSSASANAPCTRRSSCRRPTAHTRMPTSCRSS